MFLQFIIGQCIACCIGTTVETIEEFEEKVKSALSSIKYKWVIVLIAN